MSLLFDFATINLRLATIFYHLVAKWRLNNFFNFEPCYGGIGRFLLVICVLTDVQYQFVMTSLEGTYLFALLSYLGMCGFWIQSNGSGKS